MGGQVDGLGRLRSYGEEEESLDGVEVDVGWGVQPQVGLGEG